MQPKLSKVTNKRAKCKRKTFFFSFPSARNFDEVKVLAKASDASVERVQIEDNTKYNRFYFYC